MRSRAAAAVVAICLAAAARPAHGVAAPPLHRHDASRMSMACLYVIEAYGSDAAALPRVLDEALDEVDRIDRLMSHYKAESSVSRLNREAARGPVAVDAEVFGLVAEAVRYHDDSGGAFDVTVGPLMKAWGFFRGDGRVPTDGELAIVRQRVGSRHLRLDHMAKTIAFDAPGVEIDLGGIAKGYAVDRVARLLRERKVVAALISAGGSSIYGLGAPPARRGWEVTIQDPLDARKRGMTVQLRDRALSVAGSSEKSFEAGGTTYSHIMDPHTGRPVQGLLSVAVLAPSATAGDALDNALFVLGPERSRAYLAPLAGTEAFFFLPKVGQRWTIVHRRGGTS